MDIKRTKCNELTINSGKCVNIISIYENSQRMPIKRWMENINRFLKKWHHEHWANESKFLPNSNTFDKFKLWCNMFISKTVMA